MTTPEYPQLDLIAINMLSTPFFSMLFACSKPGGVDCLTFWIYLIVSFDTVYLIPLSPIIPSQ